MRKHPSGEVIQLDRVSTFVRIAPPHITSGLPTIVCHEHNDNQRAVGVRNCLTDEGRPLGTGLQEQVPNHLRRLWSKVMVVSTEGKGLGRTRSGDWQEEDRKGITDEVSKV